MRDDGEPVGPGSTKANETMRAATELVHLSGRRSAKTIRACGRDAAQQGRIHDRKHRFSRQQRRNPLQREGGPYTSFASSSTAPISLTIAASPGKMPLRSLRLSQRVSQTGGYWWRNRRTSGEQAVCGGRHASKTPRHVARSRSAPARAQGGGAPCASPPPPRTRIRHQYPSVFDTYR